MRVPGAPFGISGRENCVDKNKSTNNLGTKTITLGVAMSYDVGTAGEPPVLAGTHETLYNASTTDGSQTLHHHVEKCTCQRQLPRQEQAECHRRVDMTTCVKTNSFKNTLDILLIKLTKQRRNRYEPEMPAVQ